MSTVAKTIACDWPGCRKTITVAELDNLWMFRWEARKERADPAADSWHACPEHRFMGEEEFREAIEGESRPRDRHPD